MLSLIAGGFRDYVHAADGVFRGRLGWGRSVRGVFEIGVVHCFAGSAGLVYIDSSILTTADRRRAMPGTRRSGHPPQREVVQPARERARSGLRKPRLY